MSGWIKLHRSIQNNWLFTEKRKFSKLEAWIDIILTCNHSDNKVMIKGKLYDVKRGQSILSLDSWSKRWDWDKSSVRRYFGTLQNEAMIVYTSDNITTHLTVCKYEDYQGTCNADETPTKRRRTSNDTNLRMKEEKEYKDIPTLDEFINYGLSKNPKIKESLKLKYEAWVVNEWKDGNNKDIKNWKLSLLNTIPYLKESEVKKPTQSIINQFGSMR